MENRIKVPGDSLILLPKEILPIIKNASAEELKVLLYFFAEPDISVADAARETGITIAQAQAAVSFWRGAGIFEDSDRQKKRVASDTSAYRNYDSETIYKAIEQHSDFAMIRDLTMEKLEKAVLTKNDLSSLLYLYDFAGIPAPVICGVIEDCVSNGKKNLQYIFKTALSLQEEGIDTYDKFEAYLTKKAEINSNIGRLRKLCGMGDRALTSKEKKLFDCWFGDWKMPFDVIELAYEKTIDSTGKLSTTYMNGILRRWHESGFETIEDIKKGEASRTPGTDSSFAGDEFIEAALSRGFDD